jgi:hypothetical protein
MTHEEYDELQRYGKKRGFESMDNIIVFSNILPLLGVKTKYRGTNQETELTYCGKTRREWGNVKRNKLSKAEREELIKWQIN